MQSARLINVCSFFAHFKVRSKGGEELLFCKPVKILYNTVIIYNLQLAVRKSHCHEPVIFLISGMAWILTAFLCSNKCSGCSPVMSVCNIESRNPGEDLCNTVYVSLTAYHPEMVPETVLRNKVIFRFLCYVPCHY